VDVDQLEDLTGGAISVVSFLQHDNFTNEYAYSVKVINRTGTPIVAGTLVLVLFEAQDLSGKDALASLQVLNPAGNTAAGKPYFVVPTGGLAEFPSYYESQPIVVRVRSPDYIPFFPPAFRVRGLRRMATQNLETLVLQLKNKGVMTDAEVQQVLQPMQPTAPPLVPPPAAPAVPPAGPPVVPLPTPPAVQPSPSPPAEPPVPSPAPPASR
jgi:hypothetical protein